MDDAYESREFAEKNQGAIVSWDRYDSRTQTSTRMLGRVVGWMDPQSTWARPVVLIEPEDESIGALRDWGNQSWTTGWWWMRACDHYVEVYPFQLKIERAESSTPVPRRWPHKCTACGRPAQQLFNMVDCSNWRCRHYR